MSSPSAIKFRNFPVFKKFSALSKKTPISVEESALVNCYYIQETCHIFYTLLIYTTDFIHIVHNFVCFVK